MENTLKGLYPEYKTYKRQKCFVGHSTEAAWRDEILSACAEVLPKFGLEPWYASFHSEDYQPEGTVHFDTKKSLRDKVLEMIANARYGIYDLSYWWDDRSNQWRMPRNVFIELGIAIALNRPTLLLRHNGNHTAGLELPVCLQSISDNLLGFSGSHTLKQTLERNIPQWINTSPERDWLNRYCIFGGRSCEYREIHPQNKKWKQEAIHCHISDGPDVNRPDFRATIEAVLELYNDITSDYLDALPITQGYNYLLCSHCQTVRSSSFAIYRITAHTQPETYIAIGISLAIEKLFECRIPKLILVDKEQDLPSLLRGYEVVEAANSNLVKKKLKVFMPLVMKEIRETVWKPSPLPFIETTVLLGEAESPNSTSKLIQVLVVDDDASVRRRLASLFQTIGCEVKEAETNAHALDLLFNADMSFSLVTTDALRRPERTGETGRVGLDLVRAINQRFPELPVILVSRDTPEILLAHASDLAVNALLGKNLSDEEIITVFRRVLAGETLPNPWSDQPKPDVFLSHNSTDEAAVADSEGEASQSNKPHVQEDTPDSEKPRMPILNPFIAGGPIPSERFIGRAREINAVLSRLTGLRPASSAICGESRIGKTSLLHYLKSNQVAKEWKLASKKFTFCFIDCGGIDQPFAFNFWRRVMGELRNETQNPQIHKELGDFVISRNQSDLDIRDLLRNLAHLRHQFVLLLDEFENVIKQDMGLLNTLRVLAIESLISLVISTTIPLPKLVENIDLGGGQAFHSPFDTRELRYFTREETQILIDKALTGTGVRFTRQDRQYIWQLSQGHPFKVQFACSRIFEEKVFS